MYSIIFLILAIIPIWIIAVVVKDWDEWCNYKT